MLARICILIPCVVALLVPAPADAALSGSVDLASGTHAKGCVGPMIVRASDDVMGACIVGESTLVVQRMKPDGTFVRLNTEENLNGAGCIGCDWHVDARTDPTNGGLVVTGGYSFAHDGNSFVMLFDGSGAKVGSPLWFNTGPSSYVAGRAPDGDIVVASHGGGELDTGSVVMRYSPAGTLRQNFGNKGYVELPNASVGAIAVASDGSTYVAYRGAGILRVIKLDAVGAPVATYGTAGIASLPTSSEMQVVTPTDVRILADGSVVVIASISHFLRTGEYWSGLVARVDPQGAIPDSSTDVWKIVGYADAFSDPGGGPLPFDVTLSRVQPLGDGRLAVIGNGHPGPLVAMLDASGRRDRAFANQGVSQPVPQATKNDSVVGDLIVDAGLAMIRLRSQGSQALIAPVARITPLHGIIPPHRPSGDDVVLADETTASARFGSAVKAARSTIAFDVGWDNQDGDYGLSLHLVAGGVTQRPIPNAYARCVAVRALDSIGRVSPTVHRCFRSADSESTLTHDRNWKRVNDRHALGDHALRSTAKGASILLPRIQMGAASYLIVTKCRTCGVFDLMVNDRMVRRISLRSNATHWRVRLALPIPKNIAVRYRLVAAGVPPVTIDGFATFGR